MFSDHFYEERLSVRERNMRFLPETVTYIALKDRVSCIIAMETVMCIMHYRKYPLHSSNIPVTESTITKPAKMHQTLSLA